MMLMVPMGIALWRLYVRETAPPPKPPPVRGPRYDSSASSRLRLARNLIQQGRLAAGRAALLDIVREHPNFFPAPLELAYLGRREGKPERVLRWTARVLGLRPGAPQALDLRVWAYEQQGHPGLAEQTLQRAHTKQPASGAVALRLARFLEKRGRLDEALRVLKTTLAKGPGATVRKRLERFILRIHRRLNLPGAP